MSGDVTAAIERLREFSAAKANQAFSQRDRFYAISPDIDSVLAEVERLRAEREALHSDETVERAARAIAECNVNIGPGWWDGQMSERGKDLYRAEARAVLSVLLPKAEETR